MARLLVCLLLLGLSTGAATSAPTPATPPLVWVFDTHPDKYLIPEGKVFLKVGPKRALIEPNAQYDYQITPRARYKEVKVPASALTACSGWSAGAGEDLYVLRHKNSLWVYRRWTDEQAPEFRYKRIRTIALP